MKKVYLLFVLLLATCMGVFAQSTCSYTFYLHDGYGDGWNNAQINVMQGNTIASSVTFTTYASESTVTVTLTAGVTYDLVWVEGNFDEECSFEVAFNGMNIFSCGDASELSAGSFFTFVGCSTCFPPNPYVVAMTTTDADLAWLSGGNTQWEYTYGTVGFDPNGAAATIYTATDTIVNISGLNTGTNYDFYVRTVCDPVNNQVSAWKKYTISMPQNVVGDIPYSTGFETGDDGSNWTLVNGNNTNKWYIGTATHSTGSRALYISDNNGNTYSYDGYDESSVWAYRDIDLGTGGVDHMLSFDWKCEGYGYHYLGYDEDYDYMEVYIGLPSVMGNGTPSGATFLGKFIDNTTWQQANILLSNQFGGIQRLYFHWINSDYSYDTYLPAAVDNISITEMNCSSIDSVGVSAITTNSVTLTPYTANNATDFVLYYKESTGNTYDSLFVNITSSYTLSNLSSGTSYDVYMKVDCGNDEYGFPTNVITFRTSCDYITSADLPYTEGFEPYYLTGETFPTCWHQSSTFYNYYYTYPIISDGYYYAGDYSLYFNTDTGFYNLAVLPELDANLDVSSLTLSFMMKGYDSYYGASHNAIIGVLTSPTDLTTFTPVDTVSTTTSWSSIDVSFSNYTGTGTFIGILNQVIDNLNEENNFYIDEVALYVASDCKRPVNVTASNITSDSVTLSWTPQGTETSWNIAVVTAGGDPDTVVNLITSNTTSIAIGGLTGNTSYEAYIQADCSSETSIWTSACSFLTGCSSYGVPFLEDFNAGEMPPTQCWETAYGLLDSISSITTNSGSWYTNSTEIGSGFGGHVYLNIYGTSCKSWLISPSIDLGDGTTPYQLDLDVKLTNYYTGSSASLSGTDDIFAVVISTDNGNTWRKSNAIIWDNDSTSNSYGVYNDLADVLTHLEIPLVDQNNTPYSGVVRIALYGESRMSNADNNLRVDNFAVNPLTNCPRPTHLTATAVTADQIEVSWTAGGTENSWNITIVPADSSVSAGVLMQVTDTFNTFTNLDANTSYKIYLQADCGSETSGYVTIVAKTSCVAIDSIPYFEGFENYSSGSSSFPDCWNNLSPSTMSVYISNSQVPTGSRALYFYTYYEESGLVVMPQFDPTNYPLSTLQLNFSARTSNDDDQIIVGYVTNPTDATSFVGLDTVACASSAAESFEVPLNGCTATDAYIAFKTLPSPTAYSSIITLDDISVDLIPDCPRPTNLHVVSSTASSIDLEWTPVGTESEWEIVYDVTGFNPENATPVSVYTTPNTSVTNLYDSLTYDFYVRAVCGAGETSPWRGPVTAMPNTYSMGVTGTATVTMCGGHIYDDGGPSGNYGLNCNSILVVMPDAPGMVVQLQGTFDVENGWDYLRIYDGSDISGTLLFENPTGSGTVPLIESTTGPLTIQFTSDYMIVAGGFDLQVSCTTAPTCIKPSQLAVDNTTSSSVTLSWTERGTATAWDIEYGAQGFTQGTGTLVNVSTNPFTISNLTSGTAYDFYVRANCGGGDESDWVGPVSGIPGAFVMPTTGEYSVTMCGGTIYDDGGATGNYSSDCDVALVINPDTAGLFVHLTGTFNVEESYDWLIIIDGDDLDGNILFDSDVDATLDVVSTTGPLTIYFMSDGSLTYSGFEIQVSCESGVTPPEPCNAPTNLVATPNMEDGSVQLDWAQQGTPDSWTISYKQASAGTWSTTTTSTRPYTLTNLVMGVEYTAFVVANCGEQTSGESNHITFTPNRTGVNDYLLSSTVVYPNPTTGEFRIENSELRIENVEVYDVYGKLITTVKVEDNSVVIDLSGNASGVYFTRISTEKGMLTKRIIKK